MLTDRHDLPLSTASTAARDAYVQGCEVKLTMYPGAIKAFSRAIVAGHPGFTLANTAKAQALLESATVWQIRPQGRTSLGRKGRPEKGRLRIGAWHRATAVCGGNGLDDPRAAASGVTRSVRNSPGEAKGL
jgi:hypothetical protein